MRDEEKLRIKTLLSDQSASSCQYTTYVIGQRIIKIQTPEKIVGAYFGFQFAKPLQEVEGESQLRLSEGGGEEACVQ
jgi:hypothetical protein